MATTPVVTMDDLLKEMKMVRKEMRRIRQHIEDPTGEKTAARAQNNGFKKPLTVSAELAAFLKLAPGEQISRAQVTKSINAYVTEKGLKNGQIIMMDDALTAILTPPEDVKVTFLNIQKFINRHYIKDTPPPTPAASAEAPGAPVKKLRPKVSPKA